MGRGQSLSGTCTGLALEGIDRAVGLAMRWQCQAGNLVTTDCLVSPDFGLASTRKEEWRVPRWASPLQGQGQVLAVTSRILVLTYSNMELYRGLFQIFSILAQAWVCLRLALSAILLLSLVVLHDKSVRFQNIACIFSKHQSCFDANLEYIREEANKAIHSVEIDPVTSWTNSTIRA